MRSGDAKQTEKRAEPLRIMTYNVRYFGHRTRGIASTATSVERIASRIAAMKALPDIVCLQEVETHSIRASSLNRRLYPEETQIDRLVLELTASLRAAGRPHTFTPYYFPAHSYKLTARTNIYTTGLAILANDTLTADHHNAHRPHDITARRLVHRLKQTRICAHAVFRRADGLTIDVFNTHLSLPNFLSKAFWTGEARMGFGANQLVEARTLVDFIQNERRSQNVLLMGDFNSLPGSPVDRFLQEEGGLVDAFRTVQSHMSDADARAFGTAGFMNLRMHLDHVYSTRHAEWIDFADTHRFGEQGMFHGLSDHVPLIGRCRFPL